MAGSSKRPITEKQFFTSGDIARLFEVAPRTASKWIDKGIIKGFQLVGSADRRVERAELIKFLRNSPEHYKKLLTNIGEPMDDPNSPAVI